MGSSFIPESPGLQLPPWITPMFPSGGDPKPPWWAMLQQAAGHELAPQSIAQPNVQAPAQPQASLMQRLLHGLGQIPEHLMPLPQGMESMMSPEDVSKARHQGLLHMGLSLLGNSRGAPGQNAPSLGQALGQSLQAGQGAFGNSVQGAVQSSVGLGELAKKQQREAMRAKILGQVTSGAPEDQAMRIKAAIPQLIAAGDLEGAKALGDAHELLKQEKPVAEQFQYHDLGDRTLERNMKTGEVRYIPRGASPMSDDAKLAKENMLGMRRESIDLRRDNMQVEHERQITNDFRSEARPIVDATQAMQAVYSMLPAARAGNGLAQQNLLMGLIKLQHPNVSVKPSEMHTMASALGLGGKIERTLANWKEGSTLTQDQVEEIARQTQNLQRAWKQRYEHMKAPFSTRAKRLNIDPSFLIDPFEGLPSVQGPTTPGGSNPLFR